MFSTKSFIDLVIYWSIASFVIQIPFTIIITILVKKNLALKFEYISVMKYLLASITAFISAFLLAEQFLHYTPNPFEFIPNLLFFVMIGISFYLSITYLIDLKTRNLIKAIINEIISKNKN